MDVEKKHKSKYERKKIKYEKVFKKDNLYFFVKFLSF